MTSSTPHRAARRVARIAILLAILVARGLRLYRLGDLPPGLFMIRRSTASTPITLAGRDLPVFVRSDQERGRDRCSCYGRDLPGGGPTPVTIKLTSC
jgi:hypothetical protein